MRTIDVTGGESEYLTAVVTERYGEDLATATFHVGLGTATAKPSAWVAASATTFPTVGTARVSYLITSPAPVAPLTDKRLWVRVTDSPEVMFLMCSNEAVTVT